MAAVQTAVQTAIAVREGAENQPPVDYAPFRENLNIKVICPDCRQDPPQLIEENAETICANCGRVLDDRLVSYESEWRTFNSDEKGGEDPNRVGDVENELYIGNAGTAIGGGGMNLSKQTRALKKAQAMQNEDKNNRQLTAAYTVVDGWADQDGLPQSVKLTAKQLYKQIYDASAFRGKNTQAVLSACLFISCRTVKVDRSFAEVVNLTKVQKKEIGRTYKQIERFLSAKNKERIEKIEAEGGIVNHEAMGYTGTLSSKPSSLVPRFCAMLGLSFRVQVIALKIAEAVPNIPSLAGRSPLSAAAACIYFASNLIGQGKPSTEISNVVNVSDATVKQAYKELLKNREALIEKEWLGKQPTNAKETGPPAFGRIENLPTA